MCLEVEWGKETSFTVGKNANWFNQKTWIHFKNQELSFHMNQQFHFLPYTQMVPNSTFRRLLCPMPITAMSTATRSRNNTKKKKKKQEKMTNAQNMACTQDRIYSAQRKDSYGFHL